MLLLEFFFIDLLVFSFLFLGLILILNLKRDVNKRYGNLFILRRNIYRVIHSLSLLIQVKFKILLVQRELEN